MKPRVSFFSPLPPMNSGISDFSQSTLSEFVKSADVTAFVHRKNLKRLSGMNYEFATLQNWMNAKDDVKIIVLGNSHFHAQGVEFAHFSRHTAIIHDVQMSGLNSNLLPVYPEFAGYLSGVESLIPHAQKAVNTIVHGRTLGRNLQQLTSSNVITLPFVAQRTPNCDEQNSIKEISKKQNEPLRVGVFGDVDLSFKAADVILEAFAWLRLWKIKTEIRFIGAVTTETKIRLLSIAAKAGIQHLVSFSGRTKERTYRRELCNVDLGLIVRRDPRSSLSGAASDLASFGVPTLAPINMISEMDLPVFFTPIPESFSPITIAKLILDFIEKDQNPQSNFEISQKYVKEHSPKLYAEKLMELI